MIEMQMDSIIFLKLGGSLITDKTGVEQVRPAILARLAREIKRAQEANADLRLVLGHGSGSFGHVHGAEHGTRQGVRTAEQWAGFSQVSGAASRLNELVIGALLQAGVPALSLQPSASALCEDGVIKELAVGPVQRALEAGLLPVVFGDVAFDSVRGGTIISTEEVMMFLAGTLRPSWLLLAGETPGVLDLEGQVVPLISEANLAEIAPALGGSRGTDVTGGMAGKVRSMLDLVHAQPQMQIRIFSGLEPGQVRHTLLTPAAASGTVIRSDD
jgi:isopentenyl phosphate kinase